MIIYGGATQGGNLAEDELYLLDISKGEENGQWKIFH